jgi:MinD-like ATPase involved in chromosome partitioning or flagellar assembly
VVQANNEGVPFVLANPDAQVSLDVMAVASAIMKAPALAAVRR